MAAEDFGGKELGRPIEVLAADTATKADLSFAQAREWFTNGHVAAIMEVVGSSAALAVQEVGRIQNKIVMMSAPASLPLINENCSPTSVLYTYTTYSLAIRWVRPSWRRAARSGSSSRLTTSARTG